ncbi:SusC/RagA family TonB-linked outer membrane protein [Bacteroides thetaiotaomicron]|nr:SusC/RagA family TonB-linked outer membrane protein [Bacteroides thetaiotaomicron]
MDNARESDQKVSGSSEHQAYLSHIGRLTYDYKGKYLAELACRYDGSYRYAPGSRWAFFPSASVGWRISEESFIKDNFKFVDNLKLRFSAGRSGQDAGDPFQYFSGYTLNSGGYVFSQGNYTNGVASPVMINKNLTWIKVNMYNIGIDFSIFNRLIAVEFDIYQRDRSGLLADRYGSLPNTFGSKLPQENLNGDRTRGIEFTLTHTNKIGDFHYSVSGNFNLARTQRRYIESGPYKSSMERWRNQASNRWGDFIWGYQTDGRFQNFDEINTYPIQNGDNGNSKELPGDYILKDVNGDGVVNDLDKTPLFWSGSPLIHYGFNVEASWKNFDFYALFQGSALYTVQFDEVYAKMLCFKGGNTPEYFYDRWHLSDPYDANSEWIPGEWPAIRLEQDMGSFYTRDSQIWRKNASYLRLKTIEIGYTFSPRLMHKLGIGSLRIYANGNNLFTICDPFVKAFDPEKIEGDYSAGLNYPLNKSFNFGLTLNF